MHLDEVGGSIALVAHDAGAANLILAWHEKWTNCDIRFSLTGPAKKLWSNIQSGSNNLSIKEALTDADILISGTSYMSLAEHEARSLAVDKGIYSIAVLDHWVNYSSRFVRQNTKIMPNELWVTDIEAMKIAQQCFYNTPVFEQHNTYLENMVDRIHQINRSEDISTTRILYVLEPIRHTWADQLAPGEFQALEYFFENISVLEIVGNIEIVLRPHPSDIADKYEAWLRLKTKWDIKLDNHNPLETAIAQADIVIGCETYALVVAAASNKKVFSSLPPHAPSCRLKVKKIKHLRDLVEIA